MTRKQGSVPVKYGDFFGKALACLIIRELLTEVFYLLQNRIWLARRVLVSTILVQAPCRRNLL
jgi:hypothetical protein